MDNGRLLTFAKIARDTYLNPDKAKSAFGEYGYSIIKFFDKNGAQAYYLTNGVERVLSFRGTEVTQKSDIRADLTSGKNYESNKTLVHVGFRKEVNKIWEDILQELLNDKSDQSAPLYITGHSLGAAMATIAASRLQETMKVEALITFGSPRVGTQEFVDGLGVQHHRVINCCDSVTRVPLWIMGFRHHGVITYLDFNGNARDYSGWRLLLDQVLARKRALEKREWFSNVFDHMMDNYIYKLKLASM